MHSCPTVSAFFVLSFFHSFGRGREAHTGNFVFSIVLRLMDSPIVSATQRRTEEGWVFQNEYSRKQGSGPWLAQLSLTDCPHYILIHIGQAPYQTCKFTFFTQKISFVCFSEFVLLAR